MTEFPQIDVVTHTLRVHVHHCAHVYTSRTCTHFACMYTLHVHVHTSRINTSHACTHIAYMYTRCVHVHYRVHEHTLCTRLRITAYAALKSPRLFF